MNRRLRWLAACLLAGLCQTLAFGAEDVAGPAALYRQHCAACHGADRLGAMGPALLPESL